MGVVSGGARVDSLGGVQVLACVLPHQQGGADVHVEGANDALLRNLHTYIQQLQ